MAGIYLTGIDTLLRDHRAWWRGARVGLVAHRASVDRRGVHTIDRLRRERGVSLTCLFGPEHGFGGRRGAGQRVRHAVHPRLGIPVYSLYGVARRPAANMLREVDVLLFDLQDLGVRCYTYVSTLRFVLEAAARHNVRVVVADRPVPLPNTVDGAMLQRGLSSFVGNIPAPLVYGMTPGETARWLVEKLRLDVDLKVARLKGYRREARPAWWPTWFPPSPALRNWLSAVTYPVTVCCEALPALDCARRGRDAFQLLRATWIDGPALADELNRSGLPGVAFRAHAGVTGEGVRLVVRDGDAFLPVTTAVYLLAALRNQYGNARLWDASGSRGDFFDLLMGDRRIRAALRDGAAPAAVTGAWGEEQKAFLAERGACLLYGPRRAPPARAVRQRSRGKPRTRPTRAVVLAAGLGTRMRPLTYDLPKALVPLWGKPMLQHGLEMLRAWGVTDVTINCHHRPHEVFDFVRSFQAGLRLNIRFEPEILGTGGALPPMRGFLSEEPFWLVNADVAAELDPDPILRAMDERKLLAALWLHDAAGPRTVRMAQGRITDFASPTAGVPGTYTFCGLHLVSPEVLRFLPASGFASIIAAYRRAMRAGYTIGGVCVPKAFWADIGTPGDYLAAHRAAEAAYRRGLPGARLYQPSCRRRAEGLRGRGVRVSGLCAVGRNVRVEGGARLTDVVLWDGARVKKGSHLSRAVVGRETVVEGQASGLLAPAGVALGPDDQDALRSQGFLIRRTTVCALGARGSQRSFTRVTDGKRRALLVHYESARRENTLYAAHARFLHRVGIPVPDVLADDAARQVLLLEDLGDESLEKIASKRTGDVRLALYRLVLDHVARLHTAGTRAAKKEKLRLMPPFTQKLFAQERDLFATCFLRGHLGFTERRARGILEELCAVADELTRAPRVLVHRDLQSSNILWRDGQPVFIDFQGMRYGPAAYDVASLLCDPYVSLTPAEQEELLAHYDHLAPECEPWFWPAAVQRLSQALGAFGRLSRLPGADRFRAHISPALQMLQRALERGPYMPRLVEMVARAVS